MKVELNSFYVKNDMVDKYLERICVVIKLFKNGTIIDYVAGDDEVYLTIDKPSAVATEEYLRSLIDILSELTTMIKVNFTIEDEDGAMYLHSCYEFEEMIYSHNCIFITLKKSNDECDNGYSLLNEYLINKKLRGEL